MYTAYDIRIPPLTLICIQTHIHSRTHAPNILTLTHTEIYFNNNYLKFNKLKTDCIIFHSKRLIPLPLTHIKIANTEIEIKTNITTLGVILDKHLTLNIQISSIVKQCNNKLYQLKQIKHLLNQSSLTILTSANIISKLDYCNSILTDIPTFQERRLIKIINQTCRLIFKLPKRTHTIDYRN